jgi:hypothetical protein
MDIVILDSAYRHNITEDSILSCLFNIRGDKLLADPPPKRLYAGFDHIGNALEIIAIEDDDEQMVVIHAMKLRKQFEYLLKGGSYGL